MERHAKRSLGEQLGAARESLVSLNSEIDATTSAASQPGVTKFASGAVRSADANDVRYDLISPIALRRLAETYAYGARKYSDHNWLKGFPASDILNHLIKHLEQWRAGDRDRQPGIFAADGKTVIKEHNDHLAHAFWGLAALMHFEETRPDLIDTPPWGIVPSARGPFSTDEADPTDDDDDSDEPASTVGT